MDFRYVKMKKLPYNNSRWRWHNLFKPTPNFGMVHQGTIGGLGSSVDALNWIFVKWKDSKFVEHKVWLANQYKKMGFTICPTIGFFPVASTTCNSKYLYALNLIEWVTSIALDML